MRRGFWILFTLALASVAAYAGEIKGGIAGPSGVSVVYLEAIPGKTFPAPDKHVVMDQNGLAFSPHLLIVPVGTTVDFQNNDSVAHNVFWPSMSGNRKLAHNMGTWPKGEKKAFKFDQPGVVPLLCNVHAEMSGYIVVTPTPYYAQSDSAGNFALTNIPDGKYTVTAWHEGYKTQSKQVSVAGGARADFSLSK